MTPEPAAGFRPFFNPATGEWITREADVVRSPVEMADTLVDDSAR
jgi:hypothetical protein